MTVTGFYITIIREMKPGRKIGHLAGPFRTKSEAEARLVDAIGWAIAADPLAAFDAFGVSSLSVSDYGGSDLAQYKLIEGVLNDKLRISINAAGFCT